MRTSRWRFAGGAALCGAGFFVWRALRGLPLRQILVLVAKMKDRVPEQVETALNSGEGTRLILVCVLGMREAGAAAIAVAVVSSCKMMIVSFLRKTGVPVTKTQNPNNSTLYN